MTENSKLLSESNARIDLHQSKIGFHRKEVQYHSEWTLRHETAILRIEEEKRHFHREAMMEPYQMLSEEERKKIDRMKWSEEPCEYCRMKKVKLGKTLAVCLNCNHDNTPEKLQTPIKSEDTK